MATNEFLRWDQNRVNIETQVAYAADATRTNGVGSGTASSSLANKTWSQANNMAAMIGQFIVDIGNLDALDDGTIATLEANFEAALLILTRRNGPHGQCRLGVASTTSLVLNTYNGKGMIINGIGYQIPQAGITISNAGLVAGTLYYVYLYNNAGTLALELSVTGHATDTTATNYGVEIKSGDSTRTLVGMVMPDPSTHFVSSTVQNWVLNWFNRRNLQISGVPTPSSATSSGSLVELSSTSRVSTLMWGDEACQLTGTGYASNDTVNGGIIFTVGLDGNTTFFNNPQATSATANALCTMACASNGVFAEGNHLLSPYGSTISGSGGTATFLVSVQGTIRG